MSDRPPHHILTEFDDHLMELNARVSAFQEPMRQNLHAAENALAHWTAEGLSEAIVSAGDFVDQAGEVGFFGRQVLLRFRPVASDLRFVLARIRVCSNLGDLARELDEIARRVRGLLKQSHAEEETGLRERMQKVLPLFEMARHEFRDAMIALETHHADLADSVRRRDADLDALHRHLMDDLAATAAQGTSGEDSNAQWLVDGVFLVRALERVGDYAKNIADEVVFISSSQIANHSPG